MADATTTNYGWSYPTVNADAGTWGSTLNTTIIAIDAQMYLMATRASPTFTGTVNAAALTLSGALGGAGATFSGTVSANAFSGPLTGSVTGNVTGNCSGSSGSCTGNSATATTATNLSGGTASCTSFTASGNASIGGTLSVTGAATLGSATGVTMTSTDNSTALATTAFVQTAVSGIGLPPGVIMEYAANPTNAPTGWLYCRGTAVSRTTYAALFAIIGTTYGAGDGSTTFNLPDLRGYFVRGFDNGAGVDPGRTFASTQTDAFQGHRHGTISNSFSVTGISTGVSVYNGNNSPNLTTASTTGDPVTDGANGTPRTAVETRPKNLALNYIIKT
jgi:microcystin-dependent protein